jgi:hypothetical protein
LAAFWGNEMNCTNCSRLTEELIILREKAKEMQSELDRSRSTPEIQVEASEFEISEQYKKGISGAFDITFPVKPKHSCL